MQRIVYRKISGAEIGETSIKHAGTLHPTSLQIKMVFQILFFYFKSEHYCNASAGWCFTWFIK